MNLLDKKNIFKNDFSLKKILFIGLFFISINISCNNDSCGKIKISGENKTLYQGPKGGCYYLNQNGNKTYVAREKCNC